MKKFMDRDFLLHNQTAMVLYHDYAAGMPIYDYHCHLNPQEIAVNKKFRNITELWLGGDHYKWRAMRSNGISEQYITGDASDEEKFRKWAETVPKCIGNPLYHWTHLELRRYFGIYKLLSPETATEIWEKCNQALQQENFSVQGLILRSNVRVICTTDDPLDSLENHVAIAGSSFKVEVLPAFRPDKCVNIEHEGFQEWIANLSKLTGHSVETFEALQQALRQRIDFFHNHGCRVSDHALHTVVFEDGSTEEVTLILQKALTGRELNAQEIAKYKTALLLFFARQYAELNWAMQLHIGNLKNANTRMLRNLGPDTGFDTIGDWNYAESLAGFLNRLDETDELPKTILYCLNPRDNEVLGTMIGCFQGESVPGKVQFGSGWWFNDQKDGMIRQMTALANLGLLSRFVGMLTDSRSFISYTRHEYFRRILCNMIGEWVQNGEAPNDIKLLGKMVQDICYNNAEKYFSN